MFLFTGVGCNLDLFQAKAQVKNIDIFRYDTKDVLDGNEPSCYDIGKDNLDTAIEYLNTYYIEKYPDMGLDPQFIELNWEDEKNKVVKKIIKDNSDKKPYKALFDWVQDNITIWENKSYYSRDTDATYPKDVYNARSGIQEGRALLLCDMLRAAGIPSVLMFGYVGDIESETFEKAYDLKIFKETIWVASYCNGKWIFLDVVNDRIVTDRKKMYSNYFLKFVDNQTAIVGELYDIEHDLNKHWVWFVNNEYTNDPLFDPDDTNMNGNYFIGTIYGEFLQMGDYDSWDYYGYMADTGEKLSSKGGLKGLAYIDFGMPELFYIDRDNTTFNLFSYWTRNGRTYYQRVDITDIVEECQTNANTFYINEGTKFTLGCLDFDFETKECTDWVSSDGCIKVNKDGSLLAVKSGMSTLTSEKYGVNIDVRVEKFASEIYIDEKIEGIIGDTYVLKVRRDNNIECMYRSYWTSSDESVATVNNKGVVTMHKEGTAIITAVYGDGSGIKDTCKVTVSKADSESDKVVETKKPVVSKKPDTTQAPAKTHVPESITKKPEQTSTPVDKNTQNPKVTVTPEISETMKPTLTPITLQPAQVPEFKKSKPHKVDKEKIINKQKFQQCYFEDIDKTGINNLEIILDEGNVLTKDMLGKAKEKKKDIQIGVCDEEGNLRYSWSFEGNSIKNVNLDMDITITVDDGIQEEINEVCQLKENAVYMLFSHHGNLPSPARIKIYVGDKYNDGEGVYLYYYDEEKKQVLLVEGKELIVTNGYVEYTITHCSMYFLYDEMIENVKLENKESILSDEESVAEEKDNNTFTDSDEKENNVIGIIVVVCIAIIIIGTVICIRIKWRKNHDEIL